VYSDINAVSFLQKRKRDETKKTHNSHHTPDKKKKYKKFFDLKIKKNYRNGDLDGMGNLYQELLKSHKNKNRCLGCCICVNNKKNKSNKNKEANGDPMFPENLIKQEIEKIEEEIKFPSFDDPFQYMNSETINKNDFKLFYDNLTVYLSNLTSVINHHMRKLDEKKSNKKKFRNSTNNEKKPSRKKQKLTDYDKNDIARKINELNMKQLSDMVELFPDHVFKKDETISFNFNDFAQKILTQLKEYVEKCYGDNSNNPIHQNYRKEIEVC
jgi:hypothetical protein